MTVLELAALAALGFVTLEGPTHHVQGIDVEGTSLWVTSVDQKERKGYLMRFDLATGRQQAMVEVQDGARYHPGGVQVDGESIWVPVAEYRRESSTWVERRNKHTLALESRFEVRDHIGCVAAAGGVVWGGNWDSRDFYRWRADGTPIDRRPNPTGTGFQDLKMVHGRLVGGGGRGRESGAIDWIHPDTLAVERRIVTGRTERGASFTREGMAIREGTLYLLPEDDPSRLFRFRLP